MKQLCIGVMRAGCNVYGWTGQETTGKVFKDEQGAKEVAGLLRNEPGALFLQCSLFLFLVTNAILRAILTHFRGSHDVTPSRAPTITAYRNAFA